MKRLVVLASGSGSNFENIVEACQRKEINGDVVGLIASTSKAYALNRARRLNIESQVVLDPQDILKAIESLEADYIVLAGYLKKLSLDLVQKYNHRILNIHPSLLPKFGGHGMYGHHVFAAVLKSGEKTSGATVHWVNENFDEGPIYSQQSFAIAPDETIESLQRRTAEVEHALYIQVLKEICAV